MEEAPLERALRKGLGALETVCARPTTSLTLDEERLLVSRCRRASPRAAQVLAQRSDDWSRRTVFGVEPKRVLGYVREELHDLYENRLALALVGHLDAWLGGRLRSLRRARDAAVRALAYEDLLDGAHWQRAHRVAEIWGQAYDRSGLLELVGLAIDRVSAIHRRVLARRDSELARRLAAPRSGSIQLRMTNILANDDAYRRVADLWKVWQDSRGAELTVPTAQERWGKAQCTARAYERFVQLVVVRALASLGLEPLSTTQTPTQQVGSATAIVLRAPWTDVAFAAADGQLVVRSADAPTDAAPLRVLAIPAPLEASSSTEAWLAALPSDPNLLIVTLPGDTSTPAPTPALRRLRSLGNQGDGPGPMLTVAAPWDLESVERVARALRWYLANATYGRYPRTVTPSQGWTAPGDRGAHLAIEAGALRCVALPKTPAASAWEALEARIEQQKIKVAGLTAQRDRAKGGQQRNLQNQVATEQKVLEGDEAVLRDLEAAIDWTRRVFTCPICETQTQLVPHDGATFRATCSDPKCRATWGVTRCSEGHRFPVLAVGDDAPSEADSLDVDRTWGSDVLVLRRQGGFVCPRCQEVVH
ncbi:MAG: hypothetical protein KIT58_13555 [Planctomycetota bacterium]|nr:hypothetical protein [Planctomycetota bacterium]